MDRLPSFSVAVPVYWPDRRWPDFLRRYAEQTPRPQHSLVIASGARQNDIGLAEAAGFRCISIAPDEFDHGATRQLAIKTLAPACEIVVFLTQDACLATPDAMARLVRVFADPAIGAAWGRQIPHPDATPIAAHSRLYNYPAASRVVGREDVGELGIKAAFCSNSFAAYRLSAMATIGGFVSPTPLGEDMSAAGRLIKAGYRIAYVADATVHHSHDYGPTQEFRRHFDTGAFHAINPWLLDEFGRPQGEGARFVASQLRFLTANSPAALPKAFLGTICKYLGYQLGRYSSILPAALASRLGMNITYWKKRHAYRAGLSDR